MASLPLLKSRLEDFVCKCKRNLHDMLLFEEATMLTLNKIDQIKLRKLGSMKKSDKEKLLKVK